MDVLPQNHLLNYDEAQSRKTDRIIQSPQQSGKPQRMRLKHHIKERSPQRLFGMLALCALLVPQASPASDWVEDENVYFRPPPRRARPEPPPPPPDYGYQQAVPGRKFDFSSRDDVIDEGEFPPPLSVSDPHGRRHRGAPREKNGSVLEGNVSRFDIGKQRPLRHGVNQEVELPPPVRLPPPKTIAVEPKTFKLWLEKTHPDVKKITQVMPRETVVEVRGKWDDSGHTLRSFGIPHTRVSTGRLAESDLSKTKILVVDCAGELPRHAYQIVEQFVRLGGYLLTTDWALEGCLQRAIPGYVEWNGGYTDSRVVDATVTGSDPALLKGTVPQAHWKLDKKSQTMKIRNAGAVETLAVSRQLMMSDASQMGVLAATFKYGKGRVLHLVGHFDNNSDRAFNNALPDPAPKIGISLRQAIAGNFVAEAIGCGQEVSVNLDK